jgi:DNA polymerase IV
MQEVDSFLLEQKVSALPGVGWSGARKLEELGIKTVADLRACSAAQLQNVMGAKRGEELLGYAHGRDDREVQFAPLYPAYSACCFRLKCIAPG